MKTDIYNTKSVELIDAVKSYTLTFSIEFRIDLKPEIVPLAVSHDWEQIPHPLSVSMPPS